MSGVHDARQPEMVLLDALLHQIIEDADVISSLQLLHNPEDG